jgi:hypothetical protein
MPSSTPGGTGSGALPILECRCAVAEKARLLLTPAGCVVVGVVVGLVWKAGTRKLGRVTVEEGGVATARCRACLPILGANIAATADSGTGGARCGWAGFDAVDAAAAQKKIGCCCEAVIGRFGAGAWLSQQTGGAEFHVNTTTTASFVSLSPS